MMSMMIVMIRLMMMMKWNLDFMEVRLEFKQLKCQQQLVLNRRQSFVSFRRLVMLQLLRHRTSVCVKIALEVLRVLLHFAVLVSQIN